MKVQMYAFDTHKAVKELTEAGAKPPLAEAMVSTLGTMVENLPTRQDLQTGIAALSRDIDALREDLDDFKGETKAEFAALREELDTKLAALREEFDTNLAALRKELKADNAALKDEFDSRLVSLEEKIDSRLVSLEEKIDSRFDLFDGRLDLFDAKARNREIRMIIVLGLIVFSALGLLITFLTPFLS